MNAPYLARLTRREKQMVDCIREGMSNKEIAFAMSIKTNSVKIYSSRLFQKLKVADRVALCRWAMERQAIEAADERFAAFLAALVFACQAVDPLAALVHALSSAMLCDEQVDKMLEVLFALQLKRVA